MTFFDEELHVLAADLTAAGTGISARVRLIVLKAGLNIQKMARALISGHKRLRAYPRSITTDVGTEGAMIFAEVGPDKDLPQGPLGNIVEYGTSDSAPMKHLNPALDYEIPRFEEQLSIVGAPL